MASLASWTGWAALGVMASASLVPLVHRLRHGHRAAVESASVSTHVALGMSAGLLGFLHPLTAILSLGSAGAIGGGVLALGLGGLAFVLLLAHTGIGLKLRDPKLKRREASRRRHLTTAVCILGAASAHAAACLLGSE